MKTLLIVFIPFFYFPQTPKVFPYEDVTTGAQQISEYLPLIKEKRIAIVTNQTGVIGNRSIVDTLLSLQINIIKVFGPEHGFRGDTEAGEKVNDLVDKKTGLPIISLYGKHKKPTAEDLHGIDIVIYDIQDVGVRFYTYISTMTYVMEACAENKIPMIILDRPNPNGFYIDGPVMKPELKGFLGLHPVPVVYGMTCGEYAKMVNGEGWMQNKITCDLKIIACKNYNRNDSYELPVFPSPNLPNWKSILLYPSLGLFEGTVMSLGRGTDFPFQVLGHPSMNTYSFSFTPKPNRLTDQPKYVNEKCYGLDLRNNEYLTNHPGRINLSWLIECNKHYKGGEFFNRYFNNHSGNSALQKQIKKGISEKEIRASWNNDLNAFKKIRAKYLIYPDFTSN